MGFWSTLAGIGGTLIGSTFGFPALGAITGGVAGALTNGGSASASNPGGSTGQLPIDIGKPTVDPAVRAGLDTLQDPKNYFQAALGGSQEQLQGLLGPEVSTVLSQYDNAAKTAAELGPRGGGRTAVLAEAPFKKAAAYGTALAGARSGAAKDLAGIGEAEAGIGTQQEQLQNQFKLGQGNLNLGQNRIQLEAQAAKNKAYSDLGSGIGGILTRIITGAKNGGSKGLSGIFGSGEGTQSSGLPSFGSLGGDSGE